MDSDEAELLSNQARIFFVKNRFDKAVEPLSQLLALDPKNADAKSLLAACRAKGKSFAEAEKLAKEALEVAPSSPLPHLGLAILRAEQGKPRDADAEFAKALSLAPGDGLIHLHYSLFLKGMGKLPEALAEAEKAASLEPELEGIQKLVGELHTALPTPKAEGLPAEGEIHNAWFFAKIPRGWSYTFNEERNVHLFHDDELQVVSLSVIPLTGSPAELADFKEHFFNFVANDAGAKPSRMKERSMRVGRASEAEVAVDEAGVRIRKLYIGYPYKDIFYVINASCPEELLPQCAQKFEQFIRSFLPKGIEPSSVQSAASAPKPAAGMKEVAAHAALGLAGALLLLIGIYLLALAALSGLFSGEKGAIVYLLMMLLGFLPLASLIVRFSPKLIYMLHLVYFLLLAICAAIGYLGMNTGSLMLFDKASILTGFFATFASGAVLLLALLSLLIFITVLLYGRVKGKELADSYYEVYYLLREKCMKK